MSNRPAEIMELVRSDGEIPLQKLLECIDGGDLLEWGAVYEALDSGFGRIAPAPSMQVTCEFLLTYYLRCLVGNPESEEYLHSGFEAGHALASWAKQMDGIVECDWVLRRIEENLRHAYLKGDEVTRNRIETGALEHILERKALRRYFEHWATEEELREPFEFALSWGKAHES